MTEKKTIYSSILGRDSHVCIITPEKNFGGQPPKVLYLLHGNGDDCMAWVDSTDIEKYAAEYNLVVIMPEVESSYYCDMATGERYFTFMTEELPSLIAPLAKFSHKREDSFVAGLSMGGYGALKWALTYPKKFAGCASLSGSVDIAKRIALLPKHRLDEFRVIFGPDLHIAPENDLYALAKKAAATPEGKALHIYSACGAQDGFAGFNRDYAAFMHTMGFANFTHTEVQGGHAWHVWDSTIQPALAFFMADK